MTTNTPTDLKAPPLETHRPFPTAHRPPVDPEAPKKRHFLRWMLILLVIAGAAAYVVFEAGRPQPAKKAGGGRGRGGLGGPIPVAVQPVVRASVPVYLNGLGNVQAYYTVTIHSLVNGQLMSVMFKEGDYVKEGQVLAQIDPRPFEVQLAQAQGQLAHDEAILADAKLDLERYRTLLAQDAIPKQQLDTQVATVGQYEGSIKQDQANIDNAKLQLVYARITAPISGRIGLRLVDPGNIVHTTDTNGLLVITQLQPITVVFTIPEDSLPAVLRKLNAGARLPVEAWTRDNSKKLSSGYLLTADNQIDPTTGTARLKAVFANLDYELFPNQFVNIRLLVDTQPNQIVIPTAAIQRGQQGTFVYKVVDGAARIQQVQPGITEGNNTSIRSGLNGNDTVVVDGFDRLADGSKVRVRPPTGSATLTPLGVSSPGNESYGSGEGGSGSRGRGGKGRGARGANTDGLPAGARSPRAGADASGSNVPPAPYNAGSSPLDRAPGEAPPPGEDTRGARKGLLRQQRQQ